MLLVFSEDIVPSFPAMLFPETSFVQKGVGAVSSLLTRANGCNNADTGPDCHRFKPEAKWVAAGNLAVAAGT